VQAGRRAVDIHKIVNVDAPLEEVFAFWANYENFPRFMSHVREVRDTGGGTSHWVVDRPAGVPVEWDAVVTALETNDVLAWTSVPGSAVESSGIIRFAQNEDGTTHVDLKMTYSPPAGAIGHAAAKLLGADPKRQMDDDLARAKTFTWEALFRPDGGNYEQRWFHLQETGSDNRMLFEIRVVGDRWYLDSFNFSTTGTATLMNKERLHPLGTWYHVAAVYDGKVFSNYVNGVRQGAAQVQLSPQGPGRSSIGVRINLVSYFKGAIHSARFTRRALRPVEFLGLGATAGEPSKAPQQPEAAR
jgi:uncharacterized membrane protein